MFILPDLPYAYEALEPFMSAETLHLHHDKHHAGYVKTANDLISGGEMKAASPEALIEAVRGSGPAKLFNSAAQAWNHAFFWDCMDPMSDRPSDALSEAIEAGFNGMDGLKAAFVSEGAAHFGSGWVWLMAGPEGLTVQTTHDSENPVGRAGQTPLTVCDLWEHAYYLDHRNDRKGFLTAWFDNLADWGFASRQLAASRGQGEPWRHPLEASAAARRRA